LYVVVQILKERLLPLKSLRTFTTFTLTFISFGFNFFLGFPFPHRL